MPIRRLSWLSALLLPVLVALQVEATTTLTLKKSFVDANRDRATLIASFLVDSSHHDAKPPKKDGEIHIASSDDFDLDTVAE